MFKKNYNMKYLFTVFMLLTFTINAQQQSIEIIGKDTFVTYDYKNYKEYIHKDFTRTMTYNHGGVSFVDKYGYPAFRFEKWIDNEKEVILIFYGPIDKYWINLYECTNTIIIWNTYDSNFKRKVKIDWIANQNLMRSYLKSTIQFIQPDQFDQLIETYNVYNFQTNSIRSFY